MCAIAVELMATKVGLTSVSTDILQQLVVGSDMMFLQFLRVKALVGFLRCIVVI